MIESANARYGFDAQWNELKSNQKANKVMHPFEYK